MAYAKHLTSTQRERDHRAQVKNSAGGYSFKLDPFKRLECFLILGSEGGSYYATERKLTRENATCVEECIAKDGPAVIRTILGISESGRAPKNSPAIFALGIALKKGDVNTRRLAGHAVPQVCRTATHLFELCDVVEALGGWGRVTRKAISRWYQGKSPENLAYQLVKYRQRNGWTHRDVLRLAHAKIEDERANAVLRWAVRGEKQSEAGLLIAAYESAKNGEDPIPLIREHGLTREMLPTEALARPEVWEALLEKMPMTAMIRNLGTMSKVGLIGPMSETAATVMGRLENGELLQKARIHPISILVAMLTYKQGRGVRSDATWNVNQDIVDALDAAFYASFGNVKPMDKRVMLSMDVSGSMTWTCIAGMPGLTPRVGAAAMALVTAKTEKRRTITAFCDRFTQLAISPRMRLDTVVAEVGKLRVGGTDCSLPMRAALAEGGEFDLFCIYTDNETWHGPVHPHIALEEYRQKTGINAKLCVIGMVSNGFTIANPYDHGMLDVVGFDTATPSLISEWGRE